MSMVNSCYTNITEISILHANRTGDNSKKSRLCLPNIAAEDTKELCKSKNVWGKIYRQTSSISLTESQHFNVSRRVLQLSLSNPPKPGVKSRMKI